MNSAMFDHLQSFHPIGGKMGTKTLSRQSIAKRRAKIFVVVGNQELMISPLHGETNGFTIGK